MLILGDEEMTNGTVSIRARNGDQLSGLNLDDFVNQLSVEIDEKIAIPSLVPAQD